MNDTKHFPCNKCGTKIRLDKLCIGGDHCWCKNGGLCEECSIKEKEDDKIVNDPFSWLMFVPDEHLEVLEVGFRNADFFDTWDRGKCIYKGSTWKYPVKEGNELREAVKEELESREIKRECFFCKEIKHCVLTDVDYEDILVKVKIPYPSPFYACEECIHNKIRKKNGKNKTH